MIAKEHEFISVFADEFSEYIALRESQGRVISFYLHYCHSLDQYFFAERILKKELSVNIVEGWLQSLPPEISTRTKAVYISHYSGFAKYLHTLGLPAFIPESVIIDKSYLPYIFSEEETGLFFNVTDSLSIGNIPFANLAFPLLMRILYGCGLRINEALRLQIGDFDMESGVLLIRNAKGNRDRLVPMDDSLTEILTRYIAINRNGCPKETLLFQNRKGNQVTQWTIRYQFNRALELAGIKKPKLPRYRRNICLHCMRHCFAVNSFRKQDLAGVDMYSSSPLLSAYMGHKRMNGTETYLHMTAASGRDMIEKAAESSKGLFPGVPQ